MKKQTLPIAFCIICIVYSCRPGSDETVTIIKHGKNIEYHINIPLIKDSLHVNLSDFAGSFEFIPLETKEECMISYGMKYYIGSEYFLLETRMDGIYQFGRDGRFIRKLVDAGKGPTDFINGDWTVDEENQILYLTDLAKYNYFLRFDLNTGKYLGDLKNAVACRSFNIEYLDEGLLMVVPSGRFVENGLQDYIYCQDLSGNKVSSIPAPGSTTIIESQLSYANYCNQFRLKLGSENIIYSINGQQLIPFLTFSFGNETPTDRFQIGFMGIEMEQETESWLILDVGTTSRVSKDGDLSSRVSYLVLDKKRGKAYHRGSLFIDPTNYMDKYFSVTFCNNGMFVKVYQTIDLLEQAQKAFNDPEFKEPYRAKLKAIVSHLNEDDNPVLLVGKYR